MARRPRWARLILGGAALRGAGAWPVAARSAKAPPTPAARMVQVKYGDSVWTLAREHGDPRRDVRATVDRILRANRVQAGRLQPGQSLRIPPECLRGAAE